MLRNERGAVALVFAALFLPLLLVLSAVALEFGSAQVYRSRLQTAADAAALAGVSESDEWADITAGGRQWATHTSCVETDENGNCVRWETWGHYHTNSWPVRGVLARNAEAEARAAVPAGWEYTGYATDRSWVMLRNPAQVEAAAREAWRVNAAAVPGASAPDIRIVGNDTVEVSGAGEQRRGFLGLFGAKRGLRERVEGAAVAELR